MLSSTQRHRKHGDLKKLRWSASRARKSLYSSSFFLVSPLPLHHVLGVMISCSHCMWTWSSSEEMLSWSIPSEKGWSNCWLPGELFYWAYLQLSSGMCDKPCTLVFLPYSPLGHYCLQNCASAESPESFNQLEISWQVLNNHTTNNWTNGMLFSWPRVSDALTTITFCL